MHLWCCTLASCPTDTGAHWVVLKLDIGDDHRHYLDTGLQIILLIMAVIDDQCLVESMACRDHRPVIYHIPIVLFSPFMCCCWIAWGRHGPIDTGAHWVDLKLDIILIFLSKSLAQTASRLGNACQGTILLMTLEGMMLASAGGKEHLLCPDNQIGHIHLFGI
jgi:hypothetical protein